MNEIQRHLYKVLHGKCRFIDRNRSLRNLFVAEPTHLYSRKARHIEPLHTSDIISRAISSMNDGSQYFNPRSNTSAISCLRTQFIDGGDANANDLQIAFDAIKVLNNTQNFLSHLDDGRHDKTKAKVSSSATLRVMDRLDVASLYRGGMGFIQHPVALDFDRMERQLKPFERRKVCIGIKCDDTMRRDMTTLIALNKPMVARLSDYAECNDSKDQAKAFAQCLVYYGGIARLDWHSFTTNPNCGGRPLLNERLFLNPDLGEAQRLIRRGDAQKSDFRFFVGRETFSDEHLENVMQRNKYVAVDLEGFGDEEALFDTLWNNEQIVKSRHIRNDLWERVVAYLGDEYAQSWLQIPESIFDTELFQQLQTDHHNKMNVHFKESNKLLSDYIL